MADLKDAVVPGRHLIGVVGAGAVLGRRRLDAGGHHLGGGGRGRRQILRRRRRRLFGRRAAVDVLG